MTFLQKLTPINLLEEKAKFFADNSYNPQFIYEEELSAKKLLKYGQPQKKYLELADNILKKTYHHRNEADLLMMEGPKLTQAEVEQKIRSFLQMHNLEQRFELVWSSSFIARTTINRQAIKLRLPADFRKEGLLGMLYHEIGTHALRRINYEQQPYYKKKKKFGFSDYLKTEEGLATLHALIPHNFKLAFVSALRYLAVVQAQNSSFAKTYKLLKKYIQDEERRWTITFRQKRGLTDTSKPGGYSKDLVYFEGLVDVCHWLKNHNYDLPSLYAGKIAAKDVMKAKQLNPGFVPQLPSFYTLSREEYVKNVTEVIQENDL